MEKLTEEAGKEMNKTSSGNSLKAFDSIGLRGQDANGMGTAIDAMTR